MKEFQQTIKNSIHFEGIGLHTGGQVHLSIEPAPANHGIKIQRIDLDGQPIIKADITNISSTERSSNLEKNGAKVYTVEHLLAALTGTGVDNVLIKLDNDEVPILDGSSQQFVDGIKEVGIEKQEVERVYFPLNEVIRFYDKEKDVEMVAIPSERYEISTAIDFNSTVIGTQHAHLDCLLDFAEEIAPARTFCFLHELTELVENDLVKGGNLNNALVFADRALEESEQAKLSKFFSTPDIKVEEGLLNNVKLRFNNEPARHKLLDVVGDMTLLGMPIRAKIFATRPGHSTNIEFVKLLKTHINENKHLLKIPQYDVFQEPVVDIKGILKSLPLKYPFLLVDKIIELTEEKVVGIKMVTINEPFFQGHFPGDPVMPGVLQLEAMAQTGGILVLNTVEDPENYITYLLKVDQVKFRNIVRPGDILVFELNLVAPVRRGICQMRGHAYVGNKIAMEAIITAQIVKTK